jgi:hypothetical protein
VFISPLQGASSLLGFSHFSIPGHLSMSLYSALPKNPISRATSWANVTSAQKPFYVTEYESGNSTTRHSLVEPPRGKKTEKIGASGVFDEVREATLAAPMGQGRKLRASC